MRAVILAAFVAIFGVSAGANANVDVQSLQVAALVQANYFTGLEWKVGDTADYSIDMGGFIKGTSHNFVREETATGFWMQQDVDLMIQKAKVEVLLNKSTGQIEKLLMNGQEQSIPKNNIEIVEMKESRITVAAGTFDCIYAKIRDKGDGKISEAWINPQVVPMSGTLKAISESQFGKVVQEAKSMQFAPR
jgi:hypothetical protein